MKTFASTRILLGLAVALFGRLGAQADCGELVLSSLDRGWYDVNGHHDPGNHNYFVGDGSNVGSSGVPVRNFFVFNIPYFTQQVVSASLLDATVRVWPLFGGAPRVLWCTSSSLGYS